MGAECRSLVRREICLIIGAQNVACVFFTFRKLYGVGGSSEKIKKRCIDDNSESMHRFLYSLEFSSLLLKVSVSSASVEPL